MIDFRSIYLDDIPQPARILDIFESESTPRDTSLFFVHGGGWSGGSRTVFHKIALAFRDLGFDCGSTDYRLSAGAILHQIADVQDALASFSADLARRGRPQKIALIGSSAGSHLALMAALLPPRQPRDYQITSISVQAPPFVMEPWPDIFPAIWSGIQRAVGASYDKEPQKFRDVSPILHLTTETPPIFALLSENEHMFPLEQTDEFRTRADALGVFTQSKVYPRTEHGFFYDLDRWQQKEAFQDILHFIERTSC